MINNKRNKINTIRVDFIKEHFIRILFCIDNIENLDLYILRRIYCFYLLIIISESYNNFRVKRNIF